MNTILIKAISTISIFAKEAFTGGTGATPGVTIISKFQEARKNKRWVRFSFYCLSVIVFMYLTYRGLEASEAVDALIELFDAVAAAA